MNRLTARGSAGHLDEQNASIQKHATVYGTQRLNGMRVAYLQPAAIVEQNTNSGFYQ